MEFTLPFSTENVVELYVTFVQGGRIILEKSLKECSATGEVLKVHFTQADTLAFTSGKQVEIQIRVKFDSGDALASDIINASVERILKDGEI